MTELVRCLTPKELARRWRCRTARVRVMIRLGILRAIEIDGRVRITPEAIANAEHGPLAVRVAKRRRREFIAPEIVKMLS